MSVRAMIYTVNSSASHIPEMPNEDKARLVLLEALPAINSRVHITTDSGTFIGSIVWIVHDIDIIKSKNFQHIARIGVAVQQI